MNGIVALAIASFLFATSQGAGPEFSYDAQNIWPNFCLNNTGRQSPINILTSAITENPTLIPLEFGAGWTTPVSGTFRSAGHTVQFDPTDSANPSVTTRNHLGTYRVLQMHMHWGNNDSTGSEHTVNGGQYPLELHIVHSKMPAAPMGSGEALAVIGVFAEVANVDISGIWSQLNVSAIRDYPTSIPVSNFIYNDLLPASREYYYYIGSLTTPGCDEVVQWFVLKEPIQVPAAYLNYLRQVESSNANETLTFNFRDVQPLGQRAVNVVGSGAATQVILSTFSMLISMFVTMAVYFS